MAEAGLVLNLPTLRTFQDLKTLGLNLNRVGQVSPQTSVLVIVSGYFSPLHSGHLDYLESAAKIADQLIVIVNNNEQQILKKGKVILDEQDRLRIILALRIVDEAIIAIDKDRSVAKSLALIAESNPNTSLIFGNGGDRNSEDDIPEKDICEQYGIKMVFDFGGTEKRDSSTRINQELGIEKR